MWLAALRETDQHDPTEQHFICEDHFLPEDISRNEVSSDAIPIMPPCVEGGLSMMGSWGPDMPEEEDEQWTMDGDVEDEDDGPTDVRPPVGEPASAGQVRPSVSIYSSGLILIGTDTTKHPCLYTKNLLKLSLLISRMQLHAELQSQ